MIGLLLQSEGGVRSEKNTDGIAYNIIFDGCYFFIYDSKFDSRRENVLL